MLQEGTYSAWFKTPAGEGTGIVHLMAGQVSGQDTVLTYAGSYTIDGDRFTAIIRTHRHAQGQATIFGLDDLTLSLEGSSNGRLATCSGFASEAPGLPFQATLILSVPDQAGPATPLHPRKKFDPGKLPKLVSR
jgi:hypothetical protein